MSAKTLAGKNETTSNTYITIETFLLSASSCNRNDLETRLVGSGSTCRTCMACSACRFVGNEISISQAWGLCSCCLSSSMVLSNQMLYSFLRGLHFCSIAWCGGSGGWRSRSMVTKNKSSLAFLAFGVRSRDHEMLLCSCSFARIRLL